MIVSGVLDRIEDNALAVILVEEMGKEFVINKSLLPVEVREGTWLRLNVTGDTVNKLQVDNEKTKQIRSSVEKKLTRLRNRSGSKFKSE